MTQPALANLKAEHRARFEGFCRAPAEPVPELTQELDAYVGMLESMSRRIRGIDFSLVQRIGAACHGLLGLALADPDARIANAAVRYFLRKEEDYDETTAVLNFRDDVEVINAVCRHLRKPELVIETGA